MRYIQIIRLIDNYSFTAFAFILPTKMFRIWRQSSMKIINFTIDSYYLGMLIWLIFVFQ